MIPKFNKVSLHSLETEDAKANMTPKNILIQITSHSEKDRLRAYLSNNRDINIIDIVDSRHYTLCHICCINNNLEMLEILEEYIRENLPKLSGNIPEWVNRQNLEGYTPLHMAAFKGNINMIEYLERIGANRLSKNKHGSINK